MNRIYLDNAATTPMSKAVIETMANAMENVIGNPSSIHSYGRSVKAKLEMARKNIAKSINALPAEIVFTSGGTEADNLALNIAVNDLGVQRIITSKIEHHAVLKTCEALQKIHGVEIEYVDLDDLGQVDLVNLKVRLSKGPKTLVSLMHVNNEIGNILPLEIVASFCKEYDALFHSDTVQSIGYFNIDVKNIEIDFITCSAHKFHGPKGIGFLYVNQKHNSSPLIHGGSQERGLRAGTENIIGILGLEKALEETKAKQTENIEHILQLKRFTINKLKELNIPFHFNGAEHQNTPTILNLTFPMEKDSSMLLFNLDLAGIAISGGSACTSGSNQGSHVLKAINSNMSHPAIRVSFSKLNTFKEVESLVKVLEKLIVT